MNSGIGRYVGSTRLLSDLVTLGLTSPGFPISEMAHVEASAATVARWLLEHGNVCPELAERIAAAQLPGVKVPTVKHYEFEAVEECR